MDAPEQRAREGASGARRRAEELEQRVAEREREVLALRRKAESAEHKRAFEERRRLAEARRPVRSGSQWSSIPITGAAVALLRICTSSHEPAGTRLADMPMRLDPQVPVNRLQYDPLPVDYQKQLRKDFAALTSIPALPPRTMESPARNKVVEPTAGRKVTPPRTTATATAPTATAAAPTATAIPPSLERGAAHELPRR